MKRHDPEGKQEFGELHKLLKTTFPEYRTARDNVFDVKRLAGDLDMTAEAIYKWLRNDTLPAKRARQIVEIANKANKAKKRPLVELEVFLPFLD